MHLQAEIEAPSWPRALAPVTRLQKHLHKAHLARWKRVVAVLWSTGSNEERSWATRLASCCCTALIAQDATTGRVWPWLSRCGSRLCPFCGKGRGKRVATHLAMIIGAFNKPKHLILTYRSNSKPLKDQLQLLRKALNKLRRQPEWKERVKAGVYTIEITRNPTTGLWHPHLHIIVDSVYFPQPILARLWADCMPDGGHVWIRQVDNCHRACAEIAKYVGQAPILDGWPDHAIVAFAHAVHGARMLQKFGAAIDHPLPKADEIPDEKPDTWTVSISQICNAAAQEVPVAQDLVALVWARWPMMRGYIDSKCPPLALNGTLQTNPMLSCPVPPTLPNGRVGVLADPETIAALETALELTMLLLRGLVEAEQLDMTTFITQDPDQ